MKLPTKLNAFVLIFVGMLLFLAGCAPNFPYRTCLPVKPGAPLTTNRPACLPAIDPTNSAVIESNPGYKLGYIEFDDQGWFWGHKQWEAVKSEIESEGSNSPGGLTIVVFVHGWKNNAAYDNTNVCTFRKVLAGLSHDLPQRKVIGVYAGWRGQTLKSDWFPIPGGEELTIYNRKKVAERIGHAGAATQIFTELEMIQDDINDRTNYSTHTTVGFSTNRAELVIIGHSLGADLVFSATSQILTERLVMAARPNLQNKVRVRSLGDLVILLNPAFEASCYNNLISLATSGDITYPPDQTPVLLILRSQTDWATGRLFTGAMSLFSLDESTRSSRDSIETNLFNVVKSKTKNEYRAITHSVGNDDDYLNYNLEYTNLEYASAQERITMKQALMINSQATNSTEMLPYVFPVSEDNYSAVLQPRTNNSYVFKQRNPFLDVLVDQRIMNGHNDIANTNLIGFLREFILSSHTNRLHQITSYQIEKLN